MIQRFLYPIYVWVLRFFQIQLFIAIISLPILACWGLPVSIISPIANLIFSPILMAFLACSSIIFFTQILGIPNTIFIWALEKITGAWYYILLKGSPSWLIHLPKASIVFCIISIIFALAIIHHKTLSRTLMRSCLSLALAWFILVSLFKVFYTKHNTNIDLPFGKGSISLIKTNNTCLLIDPGYLGQKQSAYNWIMYTLLPTMRQNFGTITLDHVFILQPGIRQFQAIEELCKQANIKNLWLILWCGQSSKGLLRSWGYMKQALEHNNGTLHRIGKEKQTVHFDDATFNIVPLKKQLKYVDTQCNAIQLDYTNNKNLKTFYSAKYKPNDLS